MQGISIRPAVPADAPFAYVVEEDAMRLYAEQTWGKWNPAADRQSFIESFSFAAHRVIEVEGQAVGILSVEHRSDHLFLAKLYLLSAHRNSGIGAHVLATVIIEAQRYGWPVKLHTLAVNIRAQSFYERHGFKVESRSTERVYMIYDAA